MSQLGADERLNLTAKPEAGQNLPTGAAILNENQNPPRGSKKSTARNVRYGGVCVCFGGASLPRDCL